MSAQYRQYLVCIFEKNQHGRTIVKYSHFRNCFFFPSTNPIFLIYFYFTAQTIRYNIKPKLYYV